MPLEHSNVMGGSTAEQRINCPGSYQLEQKMPKRAATDFSDRGSMLHSAMELIIVADPAKLKDAEPLFDELEGQNLGFEGHEITRELIDDKLRPATEAWLKVKDTYGLVDWFIETRVNLERFIKGAFGTADIIAIDKDGRLHVLDWKFGDGVAVDVAGNYGAGFYAAGALYDPDPELQEFTADITGIVLHIVQPRANFPDENPLKTWETTIDWVEDIIDLAIDAAAKALQDDPPTKPGKWCRWCTAQSICPDYKSMGKEALATKPDVMDGVQLAAAIHMAELLKPWVDKVFEFAQQQMEKGVAIPGYKLVQKQSRRKWTDEKMAEKIMRSRKIKAADMWKKTIISPAQAEKLNKKLYSDRLAKYVESKSSGLTIVADTDKRPAVTSGANLLASKLENSQQKQLTDNSKG